MCEKTVSYWNSTVNKPAYPVLRQDIETETLIIGSGITGITCAWCLANSGKQVAVIEAGGICDGTTGNSTGKLTIQHGIIYDPICRKYDRQIARLYASSQTDAINFIRDRVKKDSIGCQFADSTAYLYAFTEEESEKIQKEHRAALAIGIDAQVMQSDFPPGSLCLLSFKNQAVFHPSRYVSSMADAASKKGAQIYCGTKAVLFEDNDIKTVRCENGSVIKAKHVVMATQYPFYDGLNFFFTRLYASRSYGIALEACRDWPDGNYINPKAPIRSIRTHIENEKRILILVGEDHPTGRDENSTGKHYENLKSYAEDLVGIKNLHAKWSAQDYFTPDGIPYISRLSNNSETYVATGYGKWGLSNGTLAGMMISEMIMTGQNKYEEVYSVKRADISKSPGKITMEVAGQVGELIKSKLEPTYSYKDIQPGEGRVITWDGRRAGIYRDMDGNATILDISCTHMSTELNFNADEKTWDCPAHGGRYTIDGKLLEGPPKNPLKILFHGSFKELL